MRVNDLIDKYIAYKLLEASQLGASLLEKLKTIRHVFGELDARRTAWSWQRLPPIIGKAKLLRHVKGFLYK